MGSVRIGGVWFRCHSDDHSPAHVHAELGAGKMVLDFRAGELIMSPRVNPKKLTAAEVRKIEQVAAANKKALDELWKESRKK